MSRALQKIVISVFFFAGAEVQAQIASERQLTGKIEKGQGAKAEQQVRKSLKKDSLDAESWYLLSKLYFNSAFSGFNIDSASHFAITSLRAYQRSTLKQKERLKKLPLDSIALTKYGESIDSAAFERAKQVNSEQAYLDFIASFPFARQKKAAIELRDEVAFVQALKINTYTSYQAYRNKYPQSIRAGDATARYEKLLFDEKTKDGRLKSYQDFLRGYPETTYRRVAEQHIFEISTAAGTKMAFVDFINANPGNHFRKKAIDILYHLPQTDEKHFEFYNDSLQSISKLESGYLVPILKDNRFGFINDQGKELISPAFTSITAEYICGDVRTDCLVVEGGIIGRNGKWIYRGDVDDAEDMGMGFLRIGVEDSLFVFHKSGFTLTPVYAEDARIIAENFMAIKKNGMWSLLSFAGRTLLPPVYENIETLEGLVILTKTGKKIITTAERISVVVNKNSLSESLVFDDVRLLDRGTYLVKNGPLEGALNASLEFVVPLDRQVLSKTPVGFVSERNKKFQVKGVSPLLEGKEFDQVRFYGNWISLLSTYNNQLFDFTKKRILDEDLDSVWFSNRIAFSEKNDSLKAYLLSGRSLTFPAGNAIVFIPSPDSVHYFYVIDKKKKIVYDITTGTRLFDVEADGIEYVGHRTFLITRKDVKGLIDVDGKVVLPAEYAALVPSGKEFISLLKDKKFGLYDLEKRILIKPEYARNVMPFTDELLIAFRDGFYGLINWQGQAQGKFEFEEIKNWNDTTALVKRNYTWSLYSIRKQSTSLKEIKSFKMITDTEKEKVLVIFQENYFGVVSNTRGVVIPSSFSSITNVGSAEVPLYFAEKHVEEAKIFIVIYYDQNGKLIRRQVYEEEEYEKISCEDN